MLTSPPPSIYWRLMKSPASDRRRLATNVSNPHKNDHYDEEVRLLSLLGSPKYV